jgi:hypothetical protein
MELSSASSTNRPPRNGCGSGTTTATPVALKYGQRSGSNHGIMFLPKPRTAELDDAIVTHIQAVVPVGTAPMHS